MSNIRFCDNNFAALISPSIDYSSQLTAFPFTNALNPFRSKLWKPSGCFVITAANNLIYINDGSDKTVTLTAAKYATPALLATHIQTQLNAASSGWTVTYLSVAEEYRFRFARTSTATLRLSQTTNAAWDTLGFIGAVDMAGTSITAHEQRNHTSEYAVLDMGYQANIQFFAAIGPMQNVFPISTAAVIKLYANNLNEWDAPPLSITLTRVNGGIFLFFDDYPDTRFRYWKLEIVDKYNPLGPEGLSFGHIYIGDYTSVTSRNVNRGFQKVIDDPSRVLESENGALYFDKKTKVALLDSLEMGFLPRAGKDDLEKLFQKLGCTTPFYLSIDPTNEITDSIDELTKYVVFDEPPTFQHINYDRFTFSFKIREVL